MTSEKILSKLNSFAEYEKKDSDKQRRIKKAAIKMFAEKGYANTSTSEIAKEADVAEVTIFRNYKTKENLLFSIILPFIKTIGPIMAKDFTGILRENKHSFESFIRVLVYDRYEFIKNNRDIFLIVMKEFLYRDEFMKEMIPLINQTVTGFIYAAIDCFKESGQIEDIPNKEIISLIASTILGNFALRLILGTELNKAEETAHLERIIRFISRGLSCI